MNKERLLKLADLLDAVPRKKFDMGTWGESRTPATNVPKCITKACALGWATAVPEFHAAGLHLAQYFSESRYAEVVFGEHRDEDAGQVFFDLTWPQTRELFLEGSNNPKEKAEEIRALVRASHR